MFRNFIPQVSNLEFRNSTKVGFTLVELLVVIAIIALLMGILAPSLSRARLLAMRLRCAGNLRQIDVAFNLYLNESDSTYPCARDPLPAGYWLWMGRGWRSFVEPYLGHIDPNNPSVLFCSQDFVSKDRYESTSYAYSMAFYHSPEQIDDMNSPSDTYANPVPSIRQRPTHVANPSAKIMVGEWLSNHEPVDGDNGWWNWSGSRNFLFADGQVRYLKATEIRPARDGFPNANLTINGIKGQDYPR